MTRRWLCRTYYILTAICKMLGHFENFRQVGRIWYKHPFLVKQVESSLTLSNRRWRWRWLVSSPPTTNQSMPCWAEFLNLTDKREALYTGPSLLRVQMLIAICCDDIVVLREEWGNDCALPKTDVCTKY